MRVAPRSFDKTSGPRQLGWGCPCDKKDVIDVHWALYLVLLLYWTRCPSTKDEPYLSELPTLSGNSCDQCNALQWINEILHFFFFCSWVLEGHKYPVSAETCSWLGDRNQGVPPRALLPGNKHSQSLRTSLWSACGLLRSCSPWILLSFSLICSSSWWEALRRKDWPTWSRESYLNTSTLTPPRKKMLAILVAISVHGWQSGLSWNLQIVLHQGFKSGLNCHPGPMFVSLKLHLIRFWPNYLSVFSGSKKEVFSKGMNSSSVGKACVMMSLCHPYNLTFCGDLNKMFPLVVGYLPEKTAWKWV